MESAADAVEAYRGWLTDTLEGQALADMARRKLWGINLGCFCAVGDPCHADVLLEVANSE